MRLVAALVLSLAVVMPAFAQATKAPPKAGKAPKSATVAPKKSYAALPLNERVAILNDLTWTGAYNGTATGEFGDRAIAAIKAFQKDNGGRETGILTAPERAAL